MPYYTTNVILQQVFRTAGNLGVPRQEMLDYLDLDEKTLLRPGGMVPTPVTLDALEFGATRSGQPDFGLRVGSEIPEGIFAGLAILLSHCQTLGQVADHIGHNFHVINSAVSIEYVANSSGRNFTLHLLCRGRHEPVQYSEMQFRMMVRLISFLAGRPWVPKQVRLPFARVSPLERYEQEFGCAVEFGCARTSFLFDRADENVPLAVDRENLQRLVQKAFDSLSGRAPREEIAFPRQVALTVRKQLSAGATSSAAIAAAMNLSTRSLQRRLSAHGVTLRVIIEQERSRPATVPDPGLADLAKKR